MRDVIIAFFLGVVMGIGIVFCWLFSNGGNDHFPFKKTVSKTSSKSIRENLFLNPFLQENKKKGLFLDFESEGDLKFFQLTDGLYAELSSERCSMGKHSLFLEFPQGARYPGLYWEVFDENSLIDISNYQYFGFDVYLNGKSELQLVVKVKSGKNYPKKVFEKNILIKPGKWTKVRIPVNEISRFVDPKEISYIKIFILSPRRTYELFIDALGGYPLLKKGRRSARSGVAWAGEIPLDFRVGFVESIYKVIPKRSYLVEKLDVRQRINLYLAQGEKESCQMVFYDVKHPARIKVSLQGDLNNFDISVYQVKFVRTRRPYYPVIYVGDWPDPMIPMDLSKEIDLKKGEISLFWFTFSPKPQTKAGKYMVKVRISSGDQELELPIILTVWHFSIPERPSLKTAFDVYDEFFPRFFPRRKGEDYRLWKERIKKIRYSLYFLMLDYRMSPMLKVIPTQVGFKEMITPLLKKGLNAFAVGRYGGSFGNNWPKDEKKLRELIPVYRDYAHILREMGLLNMAYIYTWDEGEIGNPVVAKVSAVIHEADPELKNMVCYHGFWDPVAMPDWGKDIDIWCFQVGHYNRLGISKLRNIGMEIWMYVSGPDGKTPNLVIDSMGVEHRIIPWMLFNEDISGFLYWAVNFWQGGDPWQNTFNTPWKQNGNGLLFYPYKGRIVPSIRCEIFRDGMEDYEYLRLLKKWQQDPRLELKEKEEISRLLDFSTLYQSFSRYTHDGAQLLKRRNEIGMFLDRLARKYEKSSVDVSLHK